MRRALWCSISAILVATAVKFFAAIPVMDSGKPCGCLNNLRNCSFSHNVSTATAPDTMDWRGKAFLTRAYGEIAKRGMCGHWLLLSPGQVDADCAYKERSLFSLMPCTPEKTHGFPDWMKTEANLLDVYPYKGAGSGRRARPDWLHTCPKEKRFGRGIILAFGQSAPTDSFHDQLVKAGYIKLNLASPVLGKGYARISDGGDGDGGDGEVAVSSTPSSQKRAAAEPPAGRTSPVFSASAAAGGTRSRIRAAARTSLDGAIEAFCLLGDEEKCQFFRTIFNESTIIQGCVEVEVSGGALDPFIAEYIAAGGCAAAAKESVVSVVTDESEAVLEEYRSHATSLEREGWTGVSAFVDDKGSLKIRGAEEISAVLDAKAPTLRTILGRVLQRPIYTVARSGDKESCLTRVEALELAIREGTSLSLAHGRVHLGGAGGDANKPWIPQGDLQGCLDVRVLSTHPISNAKTKPC